MRVLLPCLLHSLRLDICVRSAAMVVMLVIVPRKMSMTDDKGRAALLCFALLCDKLVCDFAAG